MAQLKFIIEFSLEEFAPVPPIWRQGDAAVLGEGSYGGIFLPVFIVSKMVWFERSAGGAGHSLSLQEK